MPKCNKDQIINPATNRCVKKTGKIGKQVLAMNAVNYVDKALKKKSPARKASPKKATTRKASPKKGPARKAPARKVSAKKAPPFGPGNPDPDFVAWLNSLDDTQIGVMVSPQNFGEERLVEEGERVYLTIAPMIKHVDGGSPFEPNDEDVVKVALWYDEQMKHGSDNVEYGFKYNGFWVTHMYHIVLDLTINNPSGYYGDYYLNASNKNIGAWEFFTNPRMKGNHPVHINDENYYVVNAPSIASSASDVY